jgi:hypothetical protein
VPPPAFADVFLGSFFGVTFFEAVFFFFMLPGVFALALGRVFFAADCAEPVFFARMFVAFFFVLVFTGLGEAFFCCLFFIVFLFGVLLGKISLSTLFVYISWSLSLPSLAISITGDDPTLP